MGYLQRALVALTAVITLACSGVFMGVVWKLVSDPPEVQFEMVSDACVRWEGLGCTWELLAEEGELALLSMRPWPLLRSLL